MTCFSAPVPPVAEMVARLSIAQASFETRWSMGALRLVDVDLHARLVEQCELWHEAQIVGDEAEVERQGEALCRGWVAAVGRMEREDEPHNAYMLGQHGGVLVAIGERQAAHAVERDGRQAVWLTPDAVAKMVAGLQTLGTLRELWPDVELIRVVEKYSGEPAKGDI
jgi:hypothetical protein